jgi:putative Ig domain-containing protein
MRFTKILVLTALAALVIAPAAFALRFTDDSFNTPTGITGRAYSHQFQGDGGCGPALPYQFRLLNSTLPPGLSLSKSGLVSGTPSAPGEYSFWVELSDENPPSASWCNPPKTAERIFTIKVVPGLNILQNTLNPKAAFTSAPYSFQLTAEGGGSQTWSLQSGALPAGLTLGSNGLISGTPTAEGDFTFVIKVGDGSRSDTETFTLSVVQRLKITAQAKAGEVGVPFVLALTSTGGRPAKTWSVVEGTLPTGLALSAATGEISGTPTLAGTYALKVRVTDTLGLTDTVDVPLTVAAKLAVVKKPLPAAKVGSAYRAKLAAKGGVGPLKWNILGGKPGFLPAGIKFNAKTGSFSGTPMKAGVYRLRMQVVDKLGVKSAIGILLKVKA